MKLLLIPLILLASCQPQSSSQANLRKEAKLDSLTWLLANWQMQTPEGNLTETWTSISDTAWQGASYLLTPQGDTAFSETIKLLSKDDTIYYIPTVSRQNGGHEVIFKQKTITSKEATFENPTHDFPQIITYTKTSDNTITAQIQGTQNGKERKETFPFTRAKP